MTLPYFITFPLTSGQEVDRVAIPLNDIRHIKPSNTGDPSSVVFMKFNNSYHFVAMPVETIVEQINDMLDGVDDE